MARTVHSGEPGDVFHNDTGKALWQFHCQLRNTCGLCLQYHMQIGPYWPIPLHRSCNCYQSVVLPGESARPYVDFQEVIKDLDPAQQRRVIGKASWKLVEEGVVDYADVVTKARVRTFREVVSQKKLTIDQLTGAGVSELEARKAYEAVHTLKHQASDAAKSRLIADLSTQGIPKPEIVKAVGSRIAGRVGISGPSGPGRVTVPKPKPTPKAPEFRAFSDPSRPTTPEQLDAMRRFGKEGWAGWRASLTPEQAEAIQTYKGASYDLLNRFLRTGKRSGTTPRRTLEDLKTRLDSALEGAKAPEDVIGYRGIVRLEAVTGVKPEDAESLIGKEIIDHGFMSVTLNAEAAAGFTSTHIGALIRVKVPKGATVAYIEDLKEVLEPSDAHRYDHEKELLLPRDGRYRVTKVERRADGPVILDLEVLPR